MFKNNEILESGCPLSFPPASHGLLAQPPISSQVSGDELWVVYGFTKLILCGLNRGRFINKGGL